MWRASARSSLTTVGMFGSAIVVFFHRLGVRYRIFAARISRAMRFLPCRRPAGAAQLGLHAR